MRDLPSPSPASSNVLPHSFISTSSTFPHLPSDLSPLTPFSSNHSQAHPHPHPLSYPPPPPPHAVSLSSPPVPAATTSVVPLPIALPTPRAPFPSPCPSAETAPPHQLSPQPLPPPPPPPPPPQPSIPPPPPPPPDFQHAQIHFHYHPPRHRSHSHSFTTTVSNDPLLHPSPPHLPPSLSRSRSRSSYSSFRPPDFNMSKYKYSSKNNLIQIQHPNDLGETHQLGLEKERRRFKRFRCVYITRSMHFIARNELHSPSAFLFRHLVASTDFLTICRRKRCFRREFLPQRVKPSTNSSNLTSSKHSSSSQSSPTTSFNVKQFTSTLVHNHAITTTTTNDNGVPSHHVNYRPYLSPPYNHTHVNVDYPLPLASQYAFLSQAQPFQHDPSYQFQSVPTHANPHTLPILYPHQHSLSSTSSSPDIFQSFLRNALEAQRLAHMQYKDEVMNDIHRGFTRIFHVDDPDLNILPTIEKSNPPHPLSISLPVFTSSSGHRLEQGLKVASFVVSYTSTLQRTDRILHVRDDQWSAILAVVRGVCAAAAVPMFRLWTNCMFGRRQPPGSMRWMTAALLPFVTFPTLFVPASPHSRISNELNNGVWLGIQHLAASFGRGLIHCGTQLPVELPLEWPRAFHVIRERNQIINNSDSNENDPIRINDNGEATSKTEIANGENVNHHQQLQQHQQQQHLAKVGAWLESTNLDVVEVVRRLCGLIMCGFMRNRNLMPADTHDAQAVIEWASVITSSVTYGDIGHTYTCEDCRKGMGFSTDIRILTLLSSCTLLVDDDMSGRSGDIQLSSSYARSSSSSDVVNDNVWFPRVDVPFVKLMVNGQSWDGLREWVPEACLWGAIEDDRLDTWTSVMDHTDTLILRDDAQAGMSYGVCQLSIRDCDYNDRYLVAYLLIHVMHDSARSISTHHNVHYTSPKRAAADLTDGVVKWSKRFWPTCPSEMFKRFNQLHQHTVKSKSSAKLHIDLQYGVDVQALLDLARIIEQATGISHVDLSKARHVTVLDLKKVKWGDKRKLFSPS